MKRTILLIDTDGDAAMWLNSVLPGDYTLDVHKETDWVPDQSTLSQLCLVLIDLTALPHTTELVERLHFAIDMVPVILYCSEIDPVKLVRFFHAGLKEVLLKPAQPLPLRELLQRVHAQELAVREPAVSYESMSIGSEILQGESLVMHKLRTEIYRASLTLEPVLILGESGTGKELCASLLHSQSSKASGKLCSLNCSAIPEHLFEAELFGSCRGAYTEACDRVGLVGEAEGGSLFFDEIGEMPLQMQAKMLRFMDYGHYYRIGSSKMEQASCRIIAATNRALQELLHNGYMREDLFHRLDILRINMPSLREHPGDIPLYAKMFLQQTIKKYNMKQDRGFMQSALNYLCELQWPGNMRQLRNTIIKAVCNSFGTYLSTEDIKTAYGTYQTGPTSMFNKP